MHVESWSGKGLVKNYGEVPPSTDPFPIYFNRTFGVSPTPIYNFSNYEPDAVVINLGTNDFSTTPVPSQLMFENAYRNFLNQIRQAYSEEMIFFLVCGPMSSSAQSCPYIQNVVALEKNTYYMDMQNILSNDDYGVNI